MKVVEISERQQPVENEAGEDAWARTLLRRMFDAAVAAVNPGLILSPHLPQPPKGRCVVVGAGKAAASMAAAVEAAWPDVDLTGCVAVPYRYGTECHRISVRESGHPVPDAQSVTSAEKMLVLVAGLGPEDLVLALISGGGSACMSLPAAGLSLEDKQVTNRLLLASGLDIRTMNAVRRRISAIKGGRLAAAAAPAKVVTLAISDIPGDDASAIASGPTAPDRGAAMDLVEVAKSLGPALPDRVGALLSASSSMLPLPNAEPIQTIATAADALAAAADMARSYGIEPILLGDDLEGEAQFVAQNMAARVANVSRPTVLISGGETTVTVNCPKPGRGGRNTEFLLALICALSNRPGVWALAADTDGEDGTNLGAAGAIAGPDTLKRARLAGLDANASLSVHDSGEFFSALGDLVVTGPTLTNVNDFRAILILPQDVDFAPSGE